MQNMDKCTGIPGPFIPAVASFKGQGAALPGFWRREGTAVGRRLNPVSGPSDSLQLMSLNTFFSFVKLLLVLGKLIFLDQVVILFPFRPDDETALKHHMGDFCPVFFIQAMFIIQ